MHKKAFDEIYRRFMDEKIEKEKKLEKQRNLELLQKEREIKELEQARTVKGSKGKVNKYVERVQKDIRQRQFRVEKLRQEKRLNEEKELSQMFRPKTNVSKEDKYCSGMGKQEKSGNHGDFVTFEQNDGFDEHEYHIPGIQKKDKFNDYEDNTNKLKKRQLELEMLSNELLNNQYTQSTNASTYNNVSRPRPHPKEHNVHSTGKFLLSKYK